MREIVRHKLVSAGFEIIEAVDGNEAVTMWTKERPHMVLLDLLLPGIDGFQVLETMRKNHEGTIAATPVIVLSNLYSKEDIARTKAMNVEDFMVKAYHTTEEILDRVKEVLDRQDQGK